MHNFTEAMTRARKADAIMQAETIEELEHMVDDLLDNETLLDAKRSLAHNWALSENKVLDGIIDKIKVFF